MTRNTNDDEQIENSTDDQNADDGAPASLRVGQRTVYHAEDAYYAEVRRRKKKADWPHPEPSAFHQYRQRIKSKDAENGGV